MRIMIVLAALTAAQFCDAKAANAAPWCAWYDAYTYNCGFHTFESCLETVRGAGGYCARNVYADDPAPRPRRRYPRG